MRPAAVYVIFSCTAADADNVASDDNCAKVTLALFRSAIKMGLMTDAGNLQLPLIPRRTS